MKTQAPFAAIVLTMFVAFAASTSAQSRPKTNVLKKEKVSLDTILGCSNDDFIQSVFDTDLAKMLKLASALSMAILYNQPLPEHPTDKDLASTALRTAGFQSIILGSDPAKFSIMATDFNGHSPDPAKQPFCRRDLYAEYSQSTIDALPNFVEIRADEWAFNPNELFVHADQFTFTSGIFSDAASVFFTAKRGRVEIQFLSQPDGLKLYRIFVNRPGG